MLPPNRAGSERSHTCNHLIPNTTTRHPVSPRQAISDRLT